MPVPLSRGARMAGCGAMRIGVLTGGGDCPGLNAVIRGVVRAGVNRYGHEIVGFRYGWAGVLDRTAVELTPANTAGILHRGGAVLRPARGQPPKGGAGGAPAPGRKPQG